MKYKILARSGTANSVEASIRLLESLEREVGKALAAGWEPLGGVACCVEGGELVLLQAVVKQPVPADGAAGSQAASPEGEGK